VTQPDFRPSYRLIETVEDFEQVCQKLVSEGIPFGFDIETSYDGEPREHAQLHPEENFVCGLSFTNSLAWARYAPLRHDFGTNLDNARCAAAFWPVVQTGLGVAHNLKFELRCMARWFVTHLSEHPLYGKSVRASNGYFRYRSCTLLESFAEARNRFHGLKDITFLNFRHKMAEIFDLFPQRLTKKGDPRKLTKKEQSCIRFSELDQHSQKVIDYACEDSLWSLVHHLARYPRVKDNFIYKLEMNVLPITCRMEDVGVCYDWNYMREGASRARAFADKLAIVINAELTRLVQQKIPDHPPVQINLGSSAQISKVLYDELGLTTRRKTQGGKNSTDEVALTGLAKRYPVVQQILDWRSLIKLAGTYLEVYEERFSYAPDGRTHPSWIQHGVPAGRYSAAEPPVQQSPKKYHYELTEEQLEQAGIGQPGGLSFDYNFRDGIVAPKGWYLIGFDYKNQELRVLAGEAQEPALLEAFGRGEDVHKLTASLMIGKPIGEITEKERQNFGKVMNFALSYQMGVKGLADRLGVSQDEAQALFDQYFGVYTRIKAYMDRTVASSKALGYITTRFGRIVRIWEYESSERYIYSAGERLAGNAPIQGAGTGDYPKIAMVRQHAALAQAGKLDAIQLCMNMHDALYWYVRDDVPPAEVIRVLQPAIVFPVEGWPPIEVEWSAGRRWGSMQELEVEEDGSVHIVRHEKKAPASEPSSVPVAVVAPEPVRDSRTEFAREAAAGRIFPGMDSERGREAVPALEDMPERHVIVTLEAMPDPVTWDAFRSWLQGPLSPGRNLVTVRTPDGEVTLPYRCTLSPAWQPNVTLMFGGAVVNYAPDDVDAAALAVGLTL
jgi:DNA polymerase I-like protein with 3'-5' exonuclease and polymerase domains